MCNRFRFLLFSCAMLLGGWPTMLLAYVPVQPLQPLQPLQSSSTSSFLLIASRKMKDPRFREAVILVTRHGHNGPIGIIVNHPQDATLDKIFPAYPLSRGFRLFTGGPVNPKQVSYLFRGGEALAGTINVSEHIYLAYSMPLLGELLGGARAHTGLRVVSGFAAWAPGQLENEIAHGNWYILPIDSEAIFDRPVAEMWLELFRHATTVSH